MRAGLSTIAHRLITSLLTLLLIVLYLAALLTVMLAIGRYIPEPYAQPARFAVGISATFLCIHFVGRWRNKRRVWRQTAAPLLRAADVANSFAELARNNIARIETTGDATGLAKLDCQRLGAAMRWNLPGNIRYMVVYSVVAGKTARPASLELQWTLHMACMLTDALTATTTPPPSAADMMERYRAIVVQSSQLAELLRHTARSYADGLEGRANDLVLHSKDPIVDHKLARFAAWHHAEIDSLADTLRAEFPGSITADAHLASFKPVDFPFLAIFKDHQGAKTLNGVWFPREHAEPLMKWVVEQQAMAMGRGNVPTPPASD